jgi:hypothetical protein
MKDEFLRAEVRAKLLLESLCRGFVINTTVPEYAFMYLVGQRDWEPVLWRQD